MFGKIENILRYTKSIDIETNWFNMKLFNTFVVYISSADICVRIHDPEPKQKHTRLSKE